MKLFSLRQSLIDQGVATDEGIRRHLSFIQKTLSVNPSLDVKAYKINPDNPERVMHG